ncbi:hypothetical protein NK8_72140 (plasmid) [Caballeronia sp. NK8]|nr:hypothetical protein NK8_72140 [Caballeronia sp. NK8]
MGWSHDYSTYPEGIGAVTLTRGGSDAALGLIRFVDPRMRSLNYGISPIASCVPTKAPMVSIDCCNPKHAPRIAGGVTPDLGRKLSVWGLRR